MRQTAISFKSKDIFLEGVLTTHQELRSPLPAAVLCHPHPLFGGDMDNAVIMAIAWALNASGIATLRFNFRGVGGSQGEFSKGEEERQDIRAALEFLKRWPGIDRKKLALVGYSFGAQVILQGLRSYKEARALALVSSPISSFSESAMGANRSAKLFVVGDGDRLVNVEKLREQVETLRPPVVLQVVPGADHSWRGHEQEAAQHVAAFLEEAYELEHLRCSMLD